MMLRIAQTSLMCASWLTWLTCSPSLGNPASPQPTAKPDIDAFIDSGDRGDGTFVNPVINADYSDPDVVRYQDRYYLVASTFHLSPGAVLLESSDLVHWKTINHAIPNLAELDPKLNWDQMKLYGRGVFACSLRHLTWKERQPDGTLAEKRKWFVFGTLFTSGFFVSTADDIHGTWTTRYMKDLRGEDLKVAHWDDNCPYWELNPDGTLKAAYMIASKTNGAWYNHLFRMSLDGTQLLDADARFMAVKGDTTRLRTGNTPSHPMFAAAGGGSPTGELIDRIRGGVIRTPEGYRNNHDHPLVGPWGDSLGVMNATHIPNREGTVINDIVSSEGTKIYSFRGKVAGDATFSGRHGNHQKVSDYVYIFTGQFWDNYRIPTLLRAKSIYGDRFDEAGNYLGPGTPEQPGVYESQRFNVNINSPWPAREPNQGGFVEVPQSLSNDGKEHWYFITHHGSQAGMPQSRPVSLLPVSWVGGWPLAGHVSGNRCQGEADPKATIYDGTGLEGNQQNSRRHPFQTYVPGVMQWVVPKPPIRGQHPTKVRYQDSDHFGSGEFGGQQNSSPDRLSPMWKWNFAPRDGFWSLSERPGWLRLHAFPSISKQGNFFEVGNVLCQYYQGSAGLRIDTKVDLSGMKPGQEAGLAHLNGGRAHSRIAIQIDSNGNRHIACNGKANQQTLTATSVVLRSTVDRQGKNQFSYSTDEGLTFHPFGESYQLQIGGYRGDLIGIYTFNDAATIAKTATSPGTDHLGGFVDFDYVRYDVLNSKH